MTKYVTRLSVSRSVWYGLLPAYDVGVMVLFYSCRSRIVLSKAIVMKIDKKILYWYVDGYVSRDDIESLYSLWYKRCYGNRIV